MGFGLHSFTVPLIAGLLAGPVAHASPGDQAGRAEPWIDLILKRGINGVRTMEFSRGGRLLAVADNTGSVLVAEVATGYEVWRLEQPMRLPSGAQPMSLAINSVSLSEDGRRLVLGLPGTVDLWDIQTGGKLLEIVFSSGAADCRAVLSPDGRYITAWTSDVVGVWDVDTGRQLISLKQNSLDGPFAATALSTDGSLLIVASAKRLTAVSISTGKLLWSAPLSGTETLSLSPDGQTVKAICSRRGEMSLNPTPVLLFFDAATGQATGDIDLMRSLCRVLFSSERAHAVCLVDDAPGYLFRHTLDVFDLTASGDGPAIRLSGPHEVMNRPLAHFTISPDGWYLAVSTDHGVRVWDLESRTYSDAISGTADTPRKVEISSDGAYLAVGAEEGGAFAFALAEGLDTRHNLDQRIASDFALLRKGSRFVSLGTKLQIIDLAQDRIEKECDLPRPGFFSFSFLRPSLFMDDLIDSRMDASDDLTTAVLLGEGGLLLHVIDPQSCRLIRRIKVSSIWANVDSVGQLKVSAQGTYAAVLKPSSVLILPLKGRQVRRGLKSAHINAFDISPDESLLAAGMDEGVIEVARLPALESVTRFRAGSDEVTSVRFSPDGRTLLVGSSDGSVRILDLGTGEVRELRGHSSPVISVSASKGNLLIASASLDDTIRLWDGATGREIARIFLFTGGTWAVVDGEGRFDTNNFDEVRTNLHWRSRQRPLQQLPVEAFLREFYEPGLLSRLLHGPEFSSVWPPLDSRDVTQPAVEIASIETDGSPDRVKVQVEIKAGGRKRTLRDELLQADSGAVDLSLFRDGRLVAYEPDPLRPELYNPATGRSSISFSGLQLPTAPGKTSVNFAAYAFNGERVKSRTVLERFERPSGVPARRPRAYVITFGVEAALSPAWGLWFAASDARAIERLLTTKLASTYDVVSLPLLSRYQSGGARIEEARATGVHLRAVLEVLAGREPDPVLRSAVDPRDLLRRSTPDDLIVLYIASHGYVDPDRVFYVVPYNARGDGVTEALLDRCTGISETCSAEERGAVRGFLEDSISSQELTEWMRGVDAGEMVMVLDTCYSAAVVGQDFKPGPMGDHTLGQLSYDKGIRLLAAAQEKGVAVGPLSLRGSLLTHALLRAAEGNGRLDFSAWLREAARRVPRQYREAGLAPGGVQVPKLFDFSPPAADTR